MRNIALLACALCLLLVPACGLLVEEGLEVVAEIAGEPIRIRDLQSIIRGLDFQERASANDSDPEVSFEARRKVLDEMVAKRMMVLEAESLGLEATDEEIAKILQDRAASEGKVDEIDAGIAGGVSEHEEHAEWEIEEVRSDLLIGRLADKELSEAAKRKYYDEHAEEFALKSPLVNYEIISVTLDKKEIVDTVHRLMTEKGMTMPNAYATMGRPMQILSSGGVMPTMSLDELPFPLSFRKNVEGLRKNDLSSPFHFSSGDDLEYYAIVRCVRFLTTMPYQTIAEKLHADMYSRLIQRLEEKYEVEYYDEQLKYSVGT